jgi:hypothetical protein
MKRDGEPGADEPASKRRRISESASTDFVSLLNAVENEVSVSDLCTNPNRRDGFLAGKIQMVWPAGKTFRMKLDPISVRMDSVKTVVDVEIVFVSPCSRELQKLQVVFSSGDDLRIALLGVTVDRPSSGSVGASRSVKLRLTYSDGAAFMFLTPTRSNSHQAISVWPSAYAHILLLRFVLSHGRSQEGPVS